MSIMTNYAEYPDGSYSATVIEHAMQEGDTLSKYQKDLEENKVRFIGELRCFDSKGNFQILKNLKSSKF